jgi:hypothetical protein
MIRTSRRQPQKSTYSTYSTSYHISDFLSTSFDSLFRARSLPHKRACARARSHFDSPNSCARPKSIADLRGDGRLHRPMAPTSTSSGTIPTHNQDNKKLGHILIPAYISTPERTALTYSLFPYHSPLSYLYSILYFSIFLSIRLIVTFIGVARMRAHSVLNISDSSVYKPCTYLPQKKNSSDPLVSANSQTVSSDHQSVSFRSNAIS